MSVKYSLAGLAAALIYVARIPGVSVCVERGMEGELYLMPVSALFCLLWVFFLPV